MPTEQAEKVINWPNMAPRAFFCPYAFGSLSNLGRYAAAQRHDDGWCVFYPKCVRFFCIRYPFCDVQTEVMAESRTAAFYCVFVFVCVGFERFCTVRALSPTGSAFSVDFGVVWHYPNEQLKQKVLLPLFAVYCSFGYWLELV
jgi:hypothetical protein